MPKISSFNFRVNTDDTREEFSSTVWYSTTSGWYALIPDGFEEVFHNASEEIKPLGAGSLNAGTKKNIPVVFGSSESDVKDKMSKVIHHLLSRKVVKREVIVVFRTTSDRTQYGRTESNPQHPQIGITFKLLYCTEVRVGEDGKPKYFRYENNKFLSGKSYVNKTETFLWNAHSVVVDDTPENRVFMEDLYARLSSLINKLEEFFETPDTIAALVASKQNLLGGPSQKVN